MCCVVVGRTVSVDYLTADVTSSGLKVTLDDGEVCDITKKPCRTFLHFPCDPNKHVNVDRFNPSRTYEGDKKLVCNYFIEFPPSTLGCPELNRHGNRCWYVNIYIDIPYIVHVHTLFTSQ